jgi:alpha-ketoglutarate-dependent taurine dioxygenase
VAKLNNLFFDGDVAENTANSSGSCWHRRLCCMELYQKWNFLRPIGLPLSGSIEERKNGTPKFVLLLR